MKEGSRAHSFAPAEPVSGASAGERASHHITSHHMVAVQCDPLAALEQRRQQRQQQRGHLACRGEWGGGCPAAAQLPSALRSCRSTCAPAAGVRSMHARTRGGAPHTPAYLQHGAAPACSTHRNRGDASGACGAHRPICGTGTAHACMHACVHARGCSRAHVWLEYPSPRPPTPTPPVRVSTRSLKTAPARGPQRTWPRACRRRQQRRAAQSCEWCCCCWWWWWCCWCGVV